MRTPTLSAPTSSSASSSQPPVPPSLDPPAPLLLLLCLRPAPVLPLAKLAGRTSPGFKGPALRPALGATAGPGLAICGGGCPEQAVTVAALVRPRPSGPRLPSCQVGRQKCACGSPAPILSRPPGAGLQRVSWGLPLHHLSDSPSCSVPDYHLYLPAAPGPGQSFVGGRKRPGGSEMGRVGDTGHPSHPYKERCTRPPSATGSFSVPSTQSDSTLETKELPHLIYGPRMYTIQSPPEPDHSQHTTDTGPSFTADHGLYVRTQDTTPHTVDGSV